MENGATPRLGGRFRGDGGAETYYESAAPMEKLAEGVHAFQSEYFASHRALFERLAEKGQSPETLFITCSDARVVPNLITNAGPGELFIVRNVGNVVPHPTLGGGTAAAIQFAVEVLNVTNIVVCGHTHCGAIRAVLNPEGMDRLVYVRNWLAQTVRVRDIVQERYGHLDGLSLENAAIEENVLVQLEHLREFPFIEERIASGKLLLSGWVFQIDSGEVYAFDPVKTQFVELGTRKSSTVPPPQGPMSRRTP
jgi:carbonic anhydrase